MCFSPPHVHDIRGLLTERCKMNETEFESALNSVFDSATNDRYWVALFCDGERFVSTVYSEVVRACAIQWGGKYADKWQEMSLFLREMFVAMGGVDKKDCDTAEDGLRLIHNAMCSPALFRDALGRCSVLPAFANLLYYAMRMNRDGVRVMQFLDCVDHNTADCVLQYWQNNLVENQFELAALVTKSANASPIMYPIKSTWDAGAVWNERFHVDDMIVNAVLQKDDFYVEDNGNSKPFSDTDLDPFSIGDDDVPDALYKEWSDAVCSWQIACEHALKSPRSNAKTYEGYCQSLNHRHEYIPYDGLCMEMYEFVESVGNIYQWWKHRGDNNVSNTSGGFVLGTMNESDLMRSWLE